MLAKDERGADNRYRRAGFGKHHLLGRLLHIIAGRHVRTLVDGVQTPGTKSVRWDGTNDDGQVVASGVYFYRLQAPGFAATRKFVLSK